MFSTPLPLCYNNKSNFLPVKTRKNANFHVTSFGKNSDMFSKIDENGVECCGAGKENIFSIISNVLPATISLSLYYRLRNFASIFNAKTELDKDYQLFDGVKPTGPLLKLTNIVKAMEKPFVRIFIMLPLLAVTGGTTKMLTGLALQGNESAHYKVLQENDESAAKGQILKAKLKNGAKNFATGAAIGMLAPVTSLPGNVGVPIYAILSGSAGYIVDNDNNMTNNIISNFIVAIALGLYSNKKAKYARILDANLKEVVNELKNTNLHEPEGFAQTTAYDEIQNILLTSEPISKIIYSSESDKEKITKLINENIFAAKFLQSKENTNIEISEKVAKDPVARLSRALKEDCPPSRTNEEAQEEINRLLENDEYTISKLVGVGTVAESYLATNKSGDEVCIKILKKGINVKKIEADRKKLIDTVTGGVPEADYDNKMKYLVKNINDLAAGISNETNLELEMNAANEIRKYCKLADVVRPIEAKSGIYVMEKARGISLKTFADYYEQKAYLKAADEILKDNPNDYSVLLKKQFIENNIKKIKERAPAFNDFDPTSDQIQTLLYLYMDIVNEQFVKIEKNGKTVHADIHTGNIFIDLNALQSGEGKIFTLIDTGNFIKVSKEEGELSLKINSFIKNANVEELTKVFLDGAVLPPNLSPEEAYNKILNDLETIFFDRNTRIDKMTSQNLEKLSENLLRKYNIFSNNSQLNLKKAKRTANASLWTLVHAFCKKKFITDGNLKSSGIKPTDAAKIYSNYLSKGELEEFLNIIRLGLTKGDNYATPYPGNSKKRITFALKQVMAGRGEKPKLNV